MKVKELIAKLKKYNNEDDEIIVAYWAKGDVNDMDDIYCNDIMEETNEQL
jgi:hypothetical protein